MLARTLRQATSPCARMLSARSVGAASPLNAARMGAVRFNSNGSKVSGPVIGIDLGSTYSPSNVPSALALDLPIGTRLLTAIPD